jgi:formyltetrahydrofolate hydrolase
MVWVWSRILLLWLKAQAAKVKTDKWISSALQRKKIYRMNSQPIEWEKIFSNHTSYKGLIANIHVYLKQLNSKKTTQFKEWANALSRHFSRVDLPVGSRYMKTCSTLLNIKEMQIKTTVR